LTIDANGYKGGTIENLYIAAGKKVTLRNTLGSDNGKNNQKPYVNNIYGLGAGSAVEFVSNDGLKNVQSISGAAADKQIAVSSYWSETYNYSDGTSSTYYYSDLYIYSDIFTNAKVTRTANPLFAATSTNNIYVYGPSSLSDVTLDGYVDVAAPAAVSKFTFSSVAFPTTSTVNLWKVMNLTPILDENGNQVTRDYYAWLSDITNNVWSYGFYADIPASVLALDPTGSRGYWYCYSSTPLYEETADDIDVTIAFTGCKYNGKDMNTTAIERLGTTSYSAKLTYDLDGKLYRWARTYDKDKGSWGWIIVNK
jgi:hypothetical protein